MSSRGSGADNIRNITASPLSGLDPQSLLDVRPYADGLAHYILNSRDLFGLPRKFNVAFDDGGTISAVADTNDIGFQAVRVGEGKKLPAGVYFRVLLCGITGHRQFASDAGVILNPHEAVAVAAAMIRVFAEHGDRTDRKKARLKYLVDRWGIPKFLDQTEKLLAFPLLRLPAQDCEPRGPIDRAGHIGVHAQVQPGLSYVGVVVPVGRLPVAQARAVADIADRFGSGEIRLTVWQNLILPNIPQASLLAVEEALLAAGLDFTAGPVLSGTVACTGNQGCRYAASDTKTHAVALARTLDERFPQLTQPVNLHVTGCVNSCAQHYIGDIGLMGTKVEGEEGYVVSLGGGTDADQGIAREFIPAIKFADLPPVLERLLGAFSRAGVRAKEAQGRESQRRRFEQAEANSGQGLGKERDDQEESGLTPSELWPRISFGALLSLDTPDKTRRETPLRFLPDPHPAWPPAPTRRLRGRKRSPFCTSPLRQLDHHEKRVYGDQSPTGSPRSVIREFNCS